MFHFIAFVICIESPVIIFSRIDYKIFITSFSISVAREMAIAQKEVAILICNFQTMINLAFVLRHPY